MRRERWQTLSALLFVAASLLGACGESSVEESGETHFLERCSDDSCGPGLECLCGVCSLPCASDITCRDLHGSATCVERADCSQVKACDVGCTSDGDCSGLGDGFSCRDGACRTPPPAIPAPPACDAGCETVVGHPEDDATGTVDRARDVEIGCYCRGDAEPPLDGPQRCARREDGSLLLVPDVAFTPSEPLVACTEDEWQRTRTSSDFAACERRPDVVCSVDAFCSQAGCGGFQLDEQGCLRKPCTTNDECATGESCIPVEVVASFSCQTYADTCNCGGVLLAGPPGAFCGPPPPSPGPLCDGSSTVRLYARSGGGFVEDSYDFLYPYEESALIVLGTCEYYVQDAIPSEWLTGTLTAEEAEQLATEIAYERLPEFALYHDNETCPDAGASFIQTPGATAMCTCNCGDAAPEGLEEALAGSYEAIARLRMLGTPYAGSVAAVARPSDGLPDSLEPTDIVAWSPDFPITDIVLEGEGALTRSDGTIFDDRSDAGELRKLRTLGPPNPYTFVADEEQNYYYLFVRDELPSAIQEELERFRTRALQ